MTYDDLYWTFISWGYQIKPEYYVRFKAYFMEMVRRHRVIFLHDDDNTIVAVITFFITDDAKTFSNKPEFSTPLDNETGREAFIDKMICKKWTLQARKAIEGAITGSFPTVELAYWLREPENRPVLVYKRRTKHARKDA